MAVDPYDAHVALSPREAEVLADERSWLALADRLSVRPEGTADAPLLRALRADVHLFHGRLELAAELVSAG